MYCILIYSISFFLIQCVVLSAQHVSTSILLMKFWSMLISAPLIFSILEVRILADKTIRNWNKLQPIVGIQNKISKQKTNKLTGPDNILPKILKLAGMAIVQPLASLFRYSMECKTVFPAWKTARVMPAFKKDDKADRGNYVQFQYFVSLVRSWNRRSMTRSYSTYLKITT